MNKLQEAFVSKYIQHKKYVERCYGRQVDPDDVMQVTYIQLGRQEYEVTNIENYIKKAIFQVMLNEKRRNKRYVGYQEVTDQMIFTNITPENNVDRLMLRKAIMKKLAGITKLDKILKRRLLDLMSYEEISKELDITPEQVRNNIKVSKYHGLLNTFKELL